MIIRWRTTSNPATAKGQHPFPSFFSHFLISFKGIVPQTFFFRPNLLFWIVMGCGQYPFTLSLLVSLTNSVCMCVYHNLDLNILLFLWLMPPIFKFQFEKYLNIFLLLVGFGRLLSKWPNFTKTMEWNKTGAPFYNITILHCTCWAQVTLVSSNNFQRVPELN